MARGAGLVTFLKVVLRYNSYVKNCIYLMLYNLMSLDISHHLNFILLLKFAKGEREEQFRKRKGDDIPE